MFKCVCQIISNEKTVKCKNDIVIVEIVSMYFPSHVILLLNSNKVQNHSSHFFSYYISFFFSKDLEPFVKAMCGKLEPFVEVLTNQVLSSSQIASPGPIYLI